MTRKMNLATFSVCDAVKAGLKTAVLSFEKSVCPSSARFYAINSETETRVPVAITTEKVRGEVTGDSRKESAGKQNALVINGAKMPADCDILEIFFSLRILPKSAVPANSDDFNVMKSHALAASLYQKAGGYRRIAELYLWNLANARFAWRNRDMGDQMAVTISWDDRSITFDPSLISLIEYDGMTSLTEALLEGEAQDVEDLLASMTHGFTTRPETFTISFKSKIEPCMELFPSMIFRRSESDANVDGLERAYSFVETMWKGKSVKQAIFGSNKINAALRHIDIWHNNEDFGALAVNTFGGDQSSGSVVRSPTSGKSFYSVRENVKAIFDNLMRAKNETEIDPDIHFFFANLVKGGVFGRSRTNA